MKARMSAIASDGAYPLKHQHHAGLYEPVYCRKRPGWPAILFSLAFFNTTE
jgi:hypothetical protein